MTIDPRESRIPSAADMGEYAPAPLPRLLCGRFELHGELNYGRLGTVYEAIDRTRPVGAADRAVALLRIPVLTGRTPERIERDFARLLSLRHPNIVRVFELVRDTEAYLVTMELVDGAPLCAVLDTLRPELPSRDEAFDIIRAVGTALTHAHARGAVHGDIDVANVLVGSAREIKVTFAGAWLLCRAPSAARVRDDVRGLARIAYELLAGAAPSDGRGGPTRGDGAPKRIRGLGTAQWHALRAALCGRNDRAPDVGELVTAFAPAATVAFRAMYPRVPPRLAWAAVLLVAILSLGYALRRNDSPPAEPIVDAEVSPLDPVDEIDQKVDNEPATDDDDSEEPPVSASG